jgi:aromatic ring-opening dioxygenase LigB subunit
MLVFACLVPHTPLLIPEVAKDNLALLNDTVKAYQSLEHELYATKPDLIVLLSSHAQEAKETFTINQNPKLRVDFKKFGDFLTNLEFSNDIGFGYKIKEAAETKMSVFLSADADLSYGFGVPLFYLTPHLPKIKIVAINSSKLAAQTHLSFGEIIKEQIDNSTQRVAVVVAGDLSHRLHQDSPAGFSPRGQEFDQAIIKYLAQADLKSLVSLDENLAKEAQECSWRSLLILSSIIKDLNLKPEKLSYQAPFGIGYLTFNFGLK